MRINTKKLAWMGLPFLIIITIGIIYFRGKPPPPSTYTVLQMTQLKWVDDTMMISGKTDLPAGSILEITLDKWDSSDEETSAAIDENATVDNDGAFYGQFSLGDRAALHHGPYKISFLFSPRSQPSFVLDKVGLDGQHLSGPLLQDHGLGFKTLEWVTLSHQ